MMEKQLKGFDIANEIEKAMLAAPASERYVIVTMEFKEKGKCFRIIIDRQTDSLVVTDEKDNDVTAQFLKGF